MLPTPKHLRIRPMMRILLLAALAFAATSCSSGKGHVASVSRVKQMLEGAELHPQKVKLTVVVVNATSPPPEPVNYCAAEAVRQESATSLDVDRGRATVMVFESLRDADKWTPMPECVAKPFRIRNVIAVPTHGRLSPKLRDALRQLS
jgi:hypothetical protein